MIVKNSGDRKKTRDLKILLVHNHYASIGGESRVFQLEKESLEQELGKENVKVYEVGSPRFPLSLVFSIFFSFRHYWQIYRTVRSEKIDIVHVHNFFPVLSASVFFAAKRAGAKTVQCLHNYRWWCINGNFFRNNQPCTLCADKGSMRFGIQHGCYRDSQLQSLLAVSAFGFYKWLGVFKKIDLFIAMTKFQYQQLIQLGLDPLKIQVKPNMVPSVAKLGSNKKGFVFAGRLEASKGIGLLLENWIQLPSDFELTIVGGGPMEEQLRARYHQPNIHFKGICTPQQTLDYMAQARFLIHPSLMMETFGLTIMESMRLGVPVIAFAIGTRMELVQDGLTGFLCEPHQLLSTIQKADQYQDHAAMSEAATRFAASFDQEIIVKQQLELYQKLLTA